MGVSGSHDSEGVTMDKDAARARYADLVGKGIADKLERTRAFEYAGGEDMAFVVWLARVDRVVESHAGLSAFDLPDFGYWDAFDAGERAAAVAFEMLEAEGFVLA